MARVLAMARVLGSYRISEIRSSMTAISIASDVSPSPSGRPRRDGPYSGELVRDHWLIPALETTVRDGGTVVVDLDGAYGYPSFF